MKGASKSKVATSTLFMAILWLLAPIAQAEAGELDRLSGPLLSLTGTLYRPGEKAVAGSYTFGLYLNGKEQWILDVKAARDISELTPGLAVLRDLFPSTLNVMGPKNLIAALENPELADKPIVIEGYIHVAHNLMEVTAIRNIPG
ncbi:MAG: hypothetical protein ABSG44_06475 [Thermodesulfobacteriota bacterium]